MTFNIQGPVDEIAAALAFHDGNVRATIGTLIVDCRHLREQLVLTQTAMSIGFTRGWTPSFDRDLKRE
ncbi:hypothetical protein [Pararhizobium sp. LjRoot238]|uniref:hypothetical protein n=1 Tax=Pararhizobium sp. LjRoot238 TaxID=3342293 RepID=UPI003ECE0F92